MSDDIIQTEKPQSLKNDLLVRQGRIAVTGWILFGFTLILLVIQNMIYALKPKEVFAQENGIIVGQVIFDEARIRSSDEIVADLKNWVGHCNSVNKNTIYEDLSVCLNHMTPSLAEERLAQYEANNYTTTIENVGCERTAIEFDDSATQIDRDNLGFQLTATIRGEIICKTPGEKPLSQAFKQEIYAKLVHRTTAKPLGLLITSAMDI